jgi:putative transposase
MERALTNWNTREFSDIYPYLFGTEISLSQFNKSDILLLITLGISENGVSEILGYSLSKHVHKKEAYMTYLGKLMDQGIRSPLLLTGPDGSEFTESVMEVFRRSDLQHCVRQKINSSVKTVEGIDIDLFKEGLTNVFRQNDIGCFLREMSQFRMQWKNKYNDVTESLEENMTFLMTFFKYPDSIRQYIKSSSLLRSTVRQLLVKISEEPDSMQDLDQLLASLCIARNRILMNHPLPAFQKSSEQSAMLIKEKYHSILA